MSSCNDPCADNISIIVDTGSQGPIGPPGPAAKVVEWTYYLNPGDTIVSGDDASAKPLAYTPDSVQVYLNGVQLSKRDDYTTDEDGLSIVLNEAIVNANDIMVIVSQVPPENYDPTNDNNRLQGQIDDNKEAIDGLDVRVTANETAIENLEGLADGFTTRNVKVSGVNTMRSVDETLQTQADVNLHLDRSIADTEARIDAIEGGQPDLTSDIEDLREDVDSNTGSINDNALAIGELADVVEQNVTDIGKLDSQIKALPDPYDDAAIKADVDDIAKSVGTNTIAIAKNTADIAALDEPVDLDPLNEAIATNAAGINQNAKDIVSLKATDATLTGQVNDLEAAVGDLEAIDIPEDIAFTNVDNAFDTAQTIKDGLNITGKNAFIEMDKGTALTVSNNNAYNSVIEIERSSGDVSLQLQADGQIRGVKTDGTDDTSAVSVGWFQDNVGAGGGDVDLSAYATKVELKTEEVARIQGDEQLAADLAEAILTEKYNDTALTNRIAAEEKTRKSADDTLRKNLQNETTYRTDADSALQKQLDDLQIPGVDPDLYATVVAMEKGDADTLAAAKEYTDAIEIPEVNLDGYATEEFVTNAIDAIEFPELPDDIATEAYVTDAVESQAQVQANIDRLQQQEIEINSDKIEALEGTTLDAKYRCSSRPAPNIGEFALANISNEQTFEWEACEYIKLTKTDHNNVTHDFSRIFNGDVIRLASSGTNYCSYRVVDKVEGESAVTFQVTFEARGSDDSAFETLPYDFTHFQDLNVASFATIEYSDERDKATLEAAQADAAANYLSLEDGGTVAGHVDFKEGIKLSGGSGKQFIEAENGITGKLLYAKVDQTSDEEKQRFTWGANFNYSWVPLDMKSNQIINLADPDPDYLQHAVTVNYLNEALGTLDVGSLDEYATLEYVDAQLDNTLKLNDDGYTVVEQPWKLRADTDNGIYTYLAIENDYIGIYHVKDPAEWHHAANRRYVDNNYAALTEQNTFTDTITFDKSIYARNGVIFNGRNGATAMEIRGENESLSDIWCKVRGTNRLAFICYPGQDNVGYKRVLQMNWNDEKDNPELKLAYVIDPTSNGDAANKRYVDQEIAKVGGGSDGATANSGTTTPSLAVGEMFFNTTSKILFIGDGS